MNQQVVIQRIAREQRDLRHLASSLRRRLVRSRWTDRRGSSAARAEAYDTAADRIALLIQDVKTLLRCG